ncbi:MAG: UDP-N-acetylglucosamine--N-acetylmuramyl-(pentapeptide) pyrophosphoryl-undecaprenol N-acetylglucosamine transferase [Microbacteriaceae bacterium]|nr:UDP-N-acetylglucosamine--N-acetylmuramyl-(pentapeptide) pyrophosphoryl-undecaprenol N-acetylglucosamine transferase [Microbacteriaceae bacterium]
MTNYLLAGGGTAGHVNPLLALADEIRNQSTSHKVFALGTSEGLEARLVPDRGYPLLVVARLPMPRKIGSYAFRFPKLYRDSVKKVEGYIKEFEIDVVVGFGGYASAPAYTAARNLKVPYVVHEANALPGYANRVGARKAAAVATTFLSTKLPNSVHLGMPLRPEIANLDRAVLRVTAANYLGLDPDKKTLLVTGGSLGAKKINDTLANCHTQLTQAGIQILHILGDRSDLDSLTEGLYHRIKYCDRMDYALAAADFAIARAGAATVSEFAAVGLPAAFVPYPVGNGEQKFNVQDLVSSGGALTVADEKFTPDYVLNTLLPLLSDDQELAKMSQRAKSLGIRDGAKRLLALVNGVLKV